MVKQTDLEKGAFIVAGGYLLYKFAKPIDSVVGAVADVAEDVGALAEQGGNMAEDSYNYFVDDTKIPKPQEGTFQRDVYDAGKTSARYTTTAYDNTRNFLELSRDKSLNFIKGTSNKTELDRYAQSFGNSKYINDPQVSRTILYDTKENIVGSYDNELKASLTKEATIKRRSSGSSSNKSKTKSIPKASSSKNYTPAKPKLNYTPAKPKEIPKASSSKKFIGPVKPKTTTKKKKSWKDLFKF